jgi:hypothetical protein
MVETVNRRNRTPSKIFRPFIRRCYKRIGRNEIVFDCNQTLVCLLQSRVCRNAVTLLFHNLFMIMKMVLFPRHARWLLLIGVRK